MPTDIRPTRQPPNRPSSDLIKLLGQLGNAASAAIALAIWAATGIYQVEASEVGVVLRFGAVVETTPPGLHWHLPWPIDTVATVPVTVVRKEEVGFRTVSVGPPARYRDVVEEQRMLTSDGNIVDLDFIVQYRIKDPIAFLFNVRDPEETLRDCAESAMRETIGATTIDDALTEGRAAIQAAAELLLQQMLDAYEAGMQVTTVKLQDVEPPDPVQDAFKDVISAEQDKERLINEAEGFANDILPKARGSAAQRLNEAEAYAASIVKKAEGNAGRFDLVRAEYAKAPDVTRKRLYLEAMEDVLAGKDKFIVEGSSADNLLPVLDLGVAGARAVRKPGVQAEAAGTGAN